MSIEKLDPGTMRSGRDALGMPDPVIHSPGVAKPKNGGESGPGPQSSWPKIGISLPPKSKVRLKALAGLLQTPEWRIVEQALTLLAESLSPSQRKELASILKGVVPRSDIVRTEYPVSLYPAVEAFARLWANPKDITEEAGRTLFAKLLKIPLPPREGEK